jgi:hypothetical protein
VDSFHQWPKLVGLVLKEDSIQSTDYADLHRFIEEKIAKLC